MTDGKYDYLIVGSGLFGSTFAHLAHKAGKRCLVIDKRPQLGGNLYCENIEGINVHKYGAHIFHTNNKRVWDFVNSIVEFNRYTNSPVANYHGRLYNLPFNMNTFNRMWGVTTPAEATAKIEEQKAEALKALNGREPQNLEEQALTLVGKDIFNTLIKEYTEKQWGRKCTELPAFIIRRLPVRLVFDNNYFNDKYQGIPIGGYNRLIDGLLEGVETITGIQAPLNSPYGETSLRMTANEPYPLLKENAKHMRSNQTEAETAFWEIVRGDNLGVSFRRQHALGDYIADFVCLEKQLVVEIDGAYHNDEEQQIADACRTAVFNEYGFTVLRFTNEDVLHNTDSVIEKLNKVISLLPLQGGLREAWKNIAHRLVYTGPIDEYFDYSEGRLDWRTVIFKTRVEDTPNFQGNAVVNYTSHEKPYTRVIEHKHFEMFGQDIYTTPKTVVSEEYSAEYEAPQNALNNGISSIESNSCTGESIAAPVPLSGGGLRGAEPYYPVNDDRNNSLAASYREMAAKEQNVIFGGRLAEYKYYDMAPVIEKAYLAWESISAC